MTMRRAPTYVEPEALQIIEVAFLAAARRGQADVRELAESFNNDPYQMARAIEGLDWREDLLPAWAKATTQAHKSTFNSEAKEMALEQALGQQDPLARAYVQTHGAERVARISDGSKQAIRKVIDMGLEQAIPPPLLAKKIVNHVGLLPNQVLSMNKREQQLVKAGWGGRRLAREMARFGKQLKRRRAGVIAHTETLIATNQATLDVWNMGVGEGVIPSVAKKFWIVSPDERLCPICSHLAGQKVELNAPFLGPGQEPIQRPTAHPGCRCGMGLLY